MTHFIYQDHPVSAANPLSFPVPPAPAGWGGGRGKEEEDPAPRGQHQEPGGDGQQLSFNIVNIESIIILQFIFQVMELQEKLDSMEDIGEIKQNGGGQDSDES